MTRPWRLLFSSVALGAVLFAFAGCAGLFGNNKVQHSSSLVDYLYPGKRQKVKPSIPHLDLPLSVGLAFVPANTRDLQFNEKAKMDLMDRISKEFKKIPFVHDIQVIPTAQYTNEGVSSLAYWTIVGAWIVRGEKNDTDTLMDAAVFDIPSRKLLFRAPGTSEIKGKATPVNLDKQLRVDSEAGFREASAALVKNLQTSLDAFKKKVKEQPKEYVITHKEGYGGGALGPVVSILLLVLGGLGLWLGRRT
ncbi:MAG: rhombotarget lipoprotein [Acidobacteriota bacterium]